MFDDPLAVIIKDAVHSVHEDRFLAVGMSGQGRLLLVAFTLEAGGIIRLISARRPTRRERDEYESSP